MSPRRRQVPWRRAAPGMLMLVGVILVSTLVFLLDSVRRSLAEGPRISVLAAEARGLQVGADVWISGYPSGRVTAIRFRDPPSQETRRVMIEAVLNRGSARFLRRDALANIGSASLLAPAVLKLDPGSPGSGPFNFGDTLFVARDTVAETFLALSAAGRAQMDTLFSLLDALEQRAREGRGSAARLRRDSVLSARIPRVAASLDLLAESLRRGEGLARLLSDDSLRAAARRSLRRLESALHDERAESVRDTLLDTFATLESLAGRLEALEAELAAGHGTAGRAAYDTELRDRARELRQSLAALRRDLAAEPFRWLRFQIF